MTRKALDWTKRLPTIAAALEGLHVNKALLDGEVVSEDDRGIPHFNNLQADLKSGRRDRLRYHVFDLLYLDGLDLTGAVLLDRKSLLARIMARLPAGFPLRYSEHSEEDGVMMLKHACGLGLEGIVSKRKDLPYRAGRGQHWLKTKCVQAQEFVIFGYVPSTGRKFRRLACARLLRQRKARLRRARMPSVVRVLDCGENSAPKGAGDKKSAPHSRSFTATIGRTMSCFNTSAKKGFPPGRGWCGPSCPPASPTRERPCPRMWWAAYPRV